MSYYGRHVFFCCNRRDGGRECCAAKGADRLRAYCKDRVRALGLAGPGGVRVNLAGCMDRCESGPTVVVYPDAVWYRIGDERDVDELIERHLLGGQPVARLRL